MSLKSKLSQREIYVDYNNSVTDCKGYLNVKFDVYKLFIVLFSFCSCLIRKGINIQNCIFLTWLLLTLKNLFDVFLFGIWFLEFKK